MLSDTRTRRPQDEGAGTDTRNAARGDGGVRPDSRDNGDLPTAILTLL